MTSEGQLMFVVSCLARQKARNALVATVYLFVAYSDNLLTQPLNQLKPNTLYYQKTSLYARLHLSWSFIIGNGKRQMRKRGDDIFIYQNAAIGNNEHTKGAWNGE